MDPGAMGTQEPRGSEIPRGSFLFMEPKGRRGLPSLREAIPSSAQPGRSSSVVVSRRGP